MHEEMFCCRDTLSWSSVVLYGVKTNSSLHNIIDAIKKERERGLSYLNSTRFVEMNGPLSVLTFMTFRLNSTRFVEVNGPLSVLTFMTFRLNSTRFVEMNGPLSVLTVTTFRLTNTFTWEQDYYQQAKLNGSVTEMIDWFFFLADGPIFVICSSHHCL